MDFNTVAKEFTDYYYNQFTINRADLSNLYRPDSMLTFEGLPFQGVANIIEKLSSLPFEKVEHKVTTRDAQPASVNSRDILVLVTGLLVVDDSPNPLHFSQTFHLIPDGPSYFVLNDIFRLNYG